MRILYLTHEYLDYLSDEVLYGLRFLMGENVVDYPKKEILYQHSKGKVPVTMVWGNGATAFGLPETSVDREDIKKKIDTGYFDLIINSNCWRIHSPAYKNLVVLDGQDHHLLNPTYLGRVIAYFKRELLWDVPGIEPIQFALPDHLLDDTVVDKIKLTHASFSVYPGLRQQICDYYGCCHINDWREYMYDIKRSRFGISPKGAGYDCQRHYEILGNAVLCIYLDRAAPRILREQFLDGINCLTFDSLDSLKRKIDACKDSEALIQRGRQSLHEKHLSSCRAKQLLDRITALTGKKRRYHILSSLRYGYLPYYSREIVERAKLKLMRR
jgi:hypothetical protein